MKKTGIFLIACATVVLMMLLSCKGRSASRAEAMLEDVVSIYGTPDYSDEPNRSYLPVEIFRMSAIRLPFSSETYVLPDAVVIWTPIPSDSFSQSLSARLLTPR